MISRLEGYHNAVCVCVGGILSTLGGYPEYIGGKG